MTQTSFVKPLGEVLLETGLVSAEQIQEALREQTQNSTLRLGEILARRGWLKQETANFFADRWPRYISQRRKQPIGQYLRDASLLDWQQVKSVLQEQSKTGTQFGKLIVERGWLNQDTIDFFVNSIDYEKNNQENQVLETQLSDESKQVNALREQLLNNQHCDPYQLLLIYQKALWHETLKVPNSQAQAELIKLGLLVEQDHQFVIANPTYSTKFNTIWVDKELGKLRPFEKVRVNLFKLGERASLPFAALEEVFFWTGREPFLTQSLCHAIYDFGDFIPANEEKERIAHIVQTRVIEDWSHNVAAKHFQRIIYNLVNSNSDTMDLLNRYQQILRQEITSPTKDSVQTALIELGLVSQKREQLSVANRIYAAVFNEQWVSDEIAKLQNPSGQVSGALIVSPPRDIALAESPVLVPPPGQNERRKQTTFSKIGRILIGLLLFGALGSLAAIASNRIIRNQTATRHFDEANTLFNQGNHEEAIAKYNEVLSVDGNYHQAWTNRGYALAGKGEYSQMLSSCRSATIIDPQAVYAWNCQGEALHNLKQFDEAIAAFEQAIQLDPSDPVFSINKSESLLAVKEFDSALRASQTAIEKLEEIEAQQSTPDSVKNELSIAWSMKGRVFQNTDRYAEALDAYERSLEYNANYFSAQIGKGVTLKDLEQYYDANTQFEQTLKLELSESQQAEVWFYLGLTHCKLQQPGEAMAAFDKSLSLKPDFEAAETASRNYCS